MLSIETSGPGLYEFTREVSAWLEPGDMGVLTVFVRHTSCSLLVQENADPDVCADLQSYFRKLVPHLGDPSMDWVTHRLEGPDDMPAHIKAAMLPVSLSVPVMRGELALGTWQGIYLFEHRDRPHRREVVLSI